MLPFLLSLCTTVSTQVGFPASLHLTHLFSQTPTNGNAKTHTRRHTDTQTLAVQTTWAASFKRRRLRHVLQYRGVALPLWSMIRELCCTQIELSERLPFNPPFHTQRIHRHTLQGGSWAKWHTQNGDYDRHRSLRGQCESCVRRDFCVKIYLCNIWDHIVFIAKVAFSCQF